MKRNLSVALALTALCIGLAFVTISLSGCSTVASALDIQNPDYTIRDIRPRVNVALPLSASTIDFDFNLGVDNPNAVVIHLERVDFDLFADDNRLLSSSSLNRADIPARGYGEVPLRCAVGYQEIRSIFSGIVARIEGNQVRYQVRGTAWYGTPFGTLHFPVTVYSSK